jgi:hypothetical protein
MRERASRSSSQDSELGGVGLAWVMQEIRNASDSVPIGGNYAALCIFPAHRATFPTLF